MIRIALGQINTIVGDLAGNGQKMLEAIEQAKKNGADIIAFPEMAICGYPPEDLLYKAHFVQDNQKALQALARKTKNIVAVVGFVDIDKNKRLYNAAAVIQNGKIKGVYHKEELPNYGVFDEKRYFTAGRNEKIFQVSGVPFAVNICEDIWFSDGVCRRQIKSGAKFLINISSSPYDVGKLKKREQIITSLAKKERIHVCYVNLIGGQDELVFDGGSLVADPKGKIIASGKEFEEDLFLVDLDIRPGKSKAKFIALEKAASAPKNVLRPHISPRGNQTERIYKALVLGARDYARKNNFQKVVIGISGGVDSALVAAIAVEALGKDNVVGITMPSPYTSQGTLADSRTLAKNLGFKLLEIPINDIFDSYLRTLTPHFAGKEPNITEENIQARIRGNILMGLSNKFGWLVLTTGNKSEVAVGYCTLYGDMSGGFAVIKDVSKMQVYDIAIFINKIAGKTIIPISILERAPSAELRPHQKDQDSLPEYPVLDEMIREYVEDHQSFRSMAKKNNPEIVKKVINLIDHNEYKRRQAPPGIKITPRAFGKDRRLPITNKYKEF